MSCSGCTFFYVGQTVRHLTTRIDKHKKADSPVGLHLQQCQLEENSANLSWQTIDRKQPNKIVNTRGNTYQERETGLEQFLVFHLKLTCLY